MLNQQTISDQQEAEFKALVKAWYRDTRHTSLVRNKIQHPAYRAIIDMGPVVLPLLFKELEARPGHWMVALKALTGVDPVPAGSTFYGAVDAWIELGRDSGYLPGSEDADPGDCDYVFGRSR